MKRKNVLIKSVLLKKAEKALKLAAKKAKEVHQRGGFPLVVWRQGKVVKVPANKI